MADFIKTNNIFIITVGYQLEGSDRDIMEYMASTKPAGGKAYINTTSGNELFNTVKDELDSLCAYLSISMEIYPAEVEVAPGGSTTHEMTLRHHYGPETDYTFLISDASFDIQFDDEQITLGPGNCSYLQKITLIAGESCTEGRVYYPRISITSTNSAIFSGGWYITTTINGFSVVISFSQEPTPPHWDNGDFVGQLVVLSFSTEPVLFRENCHLG